MYFFRNKEVKNQLIVNICITIIFTIISLVWEIQNSIFVILICVTFLVANMIITKIRYNSIRKLTDDIDEVLHGNTQVRFDTNSEGELSILQNEISKMTNKLIGQYDNQKKSKLYLKDSIADISHQIRTPLTSVGLLVNRLQKPDLDFEQRIQISNDIEKLIIRTDWLISSLLKISKIDSGTALFKNDYIKVKDLIRMASAPILIPLELKGGNIKIECSDEVGFYGDISWTAEAVGNILKNCMEHLQDNGEIDITATENVIFTEIVIKDNGKGIDKEDLPHIFERFYKGKNSGVNSVGIGLSLSRMILANQDATINAENNSDGGAKFIIRFYKSTV